MNKIMELYYCDHEHEPISFCGTNEIDCPLCKQLEKEKRFDCITLLYDNNDEPLGVKEVLSMEINAENMNILGVSMAESTYKMIADMRDNKSQWPNGTISDMIELLDCGCFFEDEYKDSGLQYIEDIARLVLRINLRSTMYKEYYKHDTAASNQAKGIIEEGFFYCNKFDESGDNLIRTKVVVREALK